MAPRTIDPTERYRKFVADTLAKRIPTIIRNAGEGFDAETNARLEALVRAVAANAHMVLDLSNWPFLGWEEMPARVNGRRIGDAPFFDFEFWLYFRILEAVRFPETRADPFRTTKHKDLDRHLKWADEALSRTTTLADGLRLSLDANAHDLSQIASPSARYDLGREALAIEATGLKRLNIISDNFGGEFAADLVLAVVAAEAGLEVVVHVKQLPMFVSDTTADDVTILFDRLRHRQLRQAAAKRRAARRRTLHRTCLLVVAEVLRPAAGRRTRHRRWHPDSGQRRSQLPPRHRRCQRTGRNAVPVARHIAGRPDAVAALDQILLRRGHDRLAESAVEDRFPDGWLDRRGAADPGAGYCFRRKLFRCGTAFTTRSAIASTESVTGTARTFSSAAGTSSVANWLATRVEGMYSWTRADARSVISA